MTCLSGGTGVVQKDFHQQRRGAVEYFYQPGSNKMLAYMCNLMVGTLVAALS